MEDLERIEDDSNRQDENLSEQAGNGGGEEEVGCAADHARKPHCSHRRFDLEEVLLLWAALTALLNAILLHLCWKHFNTNSVRYSLN